MSLAALQRRRMLQMVRGHPAHMKVVRRARGPEELDRGAVVAAQRVLELAMERYRYTSQAWAHRHELAREVVGS